MIDILRDIFGGTSVGEIVLVLFTVILVIAIILVICIVFPYVALGICCVFAILYAIARWIHSLINR